MFIIRIAILCAHWPIEYDFPLSFKCIPLQTNTSLQNRLIKPLRAQPLEAKSEAASTLNSRNPASLLTNDDLQ